MSEDMDSTVQAPKTINADRALELAIRSFAGEHPQTEEIIKRAAAFNGYLLVSTKQTD